jgi:hypothetical protein
MVFAALLKTIALCTTKKIVKVTFMTSPCKNQRFFLSTSIFVHLPIMVKMVLMYHGAILSPCMRKVNDAELP